MNLLIFFIIINVVNVVLQTIKSLLTTKGTPLAAAAGNALAYGLYTVLLVYMTCDLSLMAKVVIVGGCNFVGVYIVKWFEKKMRKDQLWKVEITISRFDRNAFRDDLTAKGISHNSILVGKWAVFNCYCPTQKESHNVREIAKKYNAKYFVSETKIL